MTLAEATPHRANGGLFSKLPWPTTERLQAMPEGATFRLRTPSRTIRVTTDRVRARPAISPTLSQNIGITALGLGAWGLLFPHHVARTLGLKAPMHVVQMAFGVRELVTGVTLSANPTRSGMLWARVAGDVFDIAILRGLDNPGNPKRRNARVALGFVLAVTALDLVTAIRMTNVRRNGEATQ